MILCDECEANKNDFKKFLQSCILTNKPSKIKLVGKDRLTFGQQASAISNTNVNTLKEYKHISAVHSY